MFRPRLAKLAEVNGTATAVREWRPCRWPGRCFVLEQKLHVQGYLQWCYLYEPVDDVDRYFGEYGLNGHSVAFVK